MLLLVRMYYIITFKVIRCNVSHNMSQQVLPDTAQERRGACSGVPVSDCLLSSALTSSLIAAVFHSISFAKVVRKRIEGSQFTTV